MQSNMKTTATPKDLRTFLKVKIKSLTAEAKIIRREEQKARTIMQSGFLRKHRIFNLREEARASHIAYGFVRGRKFRQVENKTKPEDLSEGMLSNIQSMVLKYGPEFLNPLRYSKINRDEIMKSILDWIKAE